MATLTAVDPSVVVISSSDEEDGIAENLAPVVLPSEEEIAVSVLGDGNGTNRKIKKRKWDNLVSHETKLVVEKSIALSDSVVTETTDVPVNLVLRKLLRGPRYFDPAGSNSDFCRNCGEEGHFAAICSMEKQKKPCFVCGMFGHNTKCCSQKCFICNKGGHIAKECPNKNHRASEGSKICLRCGYSGHDMPSCTNDYSSADLMEIQCYVCNKFGHLCCVDFEDAGSAEVSCYNCGQFGHTGLGCAKSRREASGVGSPALCYACGEEGHFVRGCTKRKKGKPHKSESSSPKLKRKREKKMAGSNSAPHDFDRPSKMKKKLQLGDWSVTPRKSRAKYGWVVNVEDDFAYKKSKAASPQVKDHGGFSHKKTRVRGGWMAEDSGCSAHNRSWYSDNSKGYVDSSWMSPATPPMRSPSIASGGHYPMFQSPYRNQGSFIRTPNSFSSGYLPYNQYSSNQRYGSSSKNRFRRS